MFDSWSWQEWLIAAVAVGWSLRLAYKFGLETGKDELADLIRRDPQGGLARIEAAQATEGRFRKWARGRED